MMPDSNHKDISSLWEHFRKSAMSLQESADPQVVDLAKVAFYSGAGLILSLIMTNIPTLSESDGIRFFRDLEQECLQYGKDLERCYQERMKRLTEAKL